jgi:beta-mannosidase
MTPRVSTWSTVLGLLLWALSGASLAVERAGARSLAGPWHYVVGDLSSPPTALPTGLALPTMPVPSNWYRHGLEHAGVVWLLREVELGEAPAWVLHFQGVDYAADVFLDGRKLGGHQGYFAPFSVLVPPDVKPGRHLLAVRVDSPNEKPADFSLRKRLIKGVLSHHDTRPGGAWSPRGQEANTGGIWGAVSLLPLQAGWLEEPNAITLEASEAEARLEVSARLTRTVGTGAYTVRYRIEDPKGRAVAEGALIPKGERLSAEVRLERPRLWWPVGLGAPELYRLHLSVQGAQGTDSLSVPFGVRTVTRDVQGRLVVNGQPVFMRGTNYIPSIYLADLTDGRLQKDVALMRSAHINAVRVHAHVTHPDFYALADREGLLVWQDFPLQWGYQDTEAFTREAVRQLREMLGLLGHHPSVVFWSAHNEAPWSSDWMIHKYPDYDPEQNRVLDQELGRVLVTEDPWRPSQQNSPPAEHLWMGWYSGSYKDFRKPTSQPLVSEFGAQAVPDLSTLKTFLEPGQLWPIEGPNLEVWTFHNFQRKELTEIAKVPMGKSVEELIANTQGYQARLNQFAAESLRLQKWQPVAGIFQFMFVEHWPSANWGVVDYLRNPKPGLAALGRAYQPLLPIAATRGGRPGLWLYVVNDGLAPVEGARLRITSTPGGTTREEKVSVPANAVRPLELSVPVPAKGQGLQLRLLGPKGQVLSENVYPPGYFAP